VSVLLPILDAQPVRPAFAQGPRSLAAVRLLRLSLTDRCNLRCMYCMPEDGVDFEKQTDLLSAADFLAVAGAARSIGVRHFKLTGGEPTVRGDLLAIVEGLTALEAHDLSMTTNGMLLDRLAGPLRAAGLHRLTISWDSQRPERFAAIVRGGARTMGGLDRLRRGIDAAVAAGFERLKFNVVVMGGVNDDEVVDFARLTLGQPWTVRFIEYMPLGESTLTDAPERYLVDNAQIRGRIERDLGALAPQDRDSEAGVGPAEVYALPGAAGRVGFISAMSQPFCQTCNRLRLTARGELRSCLFDGGEVSVLPALRPRPDREAIVRLMARCVSLKPEVHSAHGNRAMSQMGG
jgi:GTP 3',8-cyclase